MLIIAAGPVQAADAQTYPITIKHAFGTTVITKKPVRVATVDWANYEVPLALGIVPVGMAKANFGDDDGDGLLPWVKQRLEELHAPTPVLFDEGDGVDFEAIAATHPDVILAAYSGISKSDYDTLSQIAPVIAYPEAPWSTDWRTMIRMNSLGLGMPTEGEALITKLEAEIAETVAGHPELKGKTAMFITHLNASDLSTSPKSVLAASQPGKFAGSISAERIDDFDDVDIVVTYGDEKLLHALLANPLTSRMAAVQRGALVTLPGSTLGTAANPTPLSISWVLKNYVALLSEAAKKSK
jgi:iron complex transport system substrate-binding protein